MGTIRANIHKAKKQHFCDWCGRLIKVDEQYLRLFGYADWPDKPGEIKQHLRCMGYCVADKKIIEALEKAGLPMKGEGYEIIGEFIEKIV